MVSPAEADVLIAQRLPRLPAEDCPLAQAHGRILREPVRADRPLPPFDRVTMDGYALAAAIVADGHRRLRVTGLQAAGTVARALEPGATCLEISTGAVLPRGADVVVPYEEVRREGDDVELPADVDLSLGRNIHRRGSDHAAGATLVRPGTRLRGGEIAIAATCGAAYLTVASRPSVAVVATGDELVEVASRDLGPHQIRKSNDYALRAALLGSGLAGRVERLHLRDLRHEVEAGLRRVLAEFDVVLLTGGISQGKFDFLPAALAALEVEQVFRGVAQRPGKPMWFGLSPRRMPVFALPGNPVSAYTCLHRYVLPALAAMAGATPLPPEHLSLAQPVTFRAPLTYFLPVGTRSDGDGRWSAEPMPFNTSGDLAGLGGTDGFLELPPVAAGAFAAGTVARFWRWT